MSYERSSGNRGGFSFEIETWYTSYIDIKVVSVATGAASRLRLKHGIPFFCRLFGSSGNRGGFSFEIETLL